MTRPSLAGQVGLWSGVLDSLPIPEARHFLATLEEQGWSSFWYGEAYGREAFTNAAMMLGATERLTIGTGIANIYARDAMTMVTAGRTVADQYPGRFVNGIGVSHKPMVERMRGHEYGSPLETLREYLVRMEQVRYGAYGTQRPPVVVAALGPKMLELARDHTDGAHPYLVLPEWTARTREILGPDKKIYVEQAVCVPTDEDTFRARAHHHLNSYTGLPNYRNSWLRQGFTQEDFVRGGSARLQDAMVVRGDDAIRARIEEHLAAGADEVLVQIVGDEPGQLPPADAAHLADVLL